MLYIGRNHLSGILGDLDDLKNCHFIVLFGWGVGDLLIKQKNNNRFVEGQEMGRRLIRCFIFLIFFGETYLYIVNRTWKMNRVHEEAIYCLKKDIEHDYSWTYIFLDGGFKHVLFSP